MFCKRVVLSREEVELRDKIAAFAGYGKQYLVHLHVPLSLFLDPNQFFGREKDYIFRSKTRLLFTKPGRNAVPFLAVGCLPVTNGKLVAHLLASVGIQYLESTDLTEIARVLPDAIRCAQMSPRTDKRLRLFINDDHWKSLCFVEKLADELAEFPELLILPEMAMASLIEVEDRTAKRFRDIADTRRIEFLEKTSIDIVILRKTCTGEATTLVAVEVDGGIHKDNKGKAENDARKNEICREAGLCLLRLSARNTLAFFKHDRRLSDSDVDLYKSIPIDLLYFLIKRTVYELAGLAQELDNWEAECVKQRTHLLAPVERRCLEDDLWFNHHEYTVRPRPENSEFGFEQDIWRLQEYRQAKNVQFKLEETEDDAHYGVLEVTGSQPGTDLFLVSRAVDLSGYACPEFPFKDLTRWALASYLITEAMRIPFSKESAQRRDTRRTRTSVPWHPAECTYLRQGQAKGRSVEDIAFALQRTVSAVQDKLKKLEFDPKEGRV